MTPEETIIFSFFAKKEPVNNRILRLAIPNIISNVTIPLLGLVDLALMGHLDSDIYIGAVSLGTVIFNFIYWGFSFLRMGTSGFTAQSYGEKNKKRKFQYPSACTFHFHADQSAYYCHANSDRMDQFQTHKWKSEC